MLLGQTSLALPSAVHLQLPICNQHKTGYIRLARGIHLSTGHVIPALNEPNDRGFAIARSADESDSLTRMRLQVEPSQHLHLGPLGVREVDVLDLQLPLDLCQLLGCTNALQTVHADPSLHDSAHLL